MHQASLQARQWAAERRPPPFHLPKEGSANLSQLKCKKRFKRKKIQMLSNEIYTFWKLSIKW